MLRTVEEDEKVLEEIRLYYLDGENLMDMECVPQEFCIDGLLPQGLCILGGAPKVGKSWLVLDWCLRIAKGEPVWNRRTRKGTTLYLCLEDTYERVQKRLSFMTDDIPRDMCFANASGTLADTLEEQIRFFLRERPDTVLVVIDTFEMVRANSGDPSYGGDYQEVEKLKQLADNLRITILLVHHLRKQDDRDPVNRLSGTTGISGAADAIFILEKKERTQSAALMKCTGRDIEDRVLELQFSKEDYVWELVSESGQDAWIPKVMDSFLAFMKEEESFSGGNTELAEAFNSHTGERVEPKRLKQLMNVWRAQLLEQGVSFHSHRSNGQRLVDVQYTLPVTQVTQKTGP